MHVEINAGCLFAVLLVILMVIIVRHKKPVEKDLTERPTMSATHCRIKPNLFDELVRLGSPIMEAEHLSTLVGTTGTVVDREEKSPGMVWMLFAPEGLQVRIWLPETCCEPMNEQEP